MPGGGGGEAPSGGPGLSARTGRRVLRLEHISKVFERDGSPVHALSDVSLELEPGHFGTLLGPSGCGKTTLLRIVAGLTPPTAGSVFVDGKESSGPSWDKAFVFQHFNLFPWRTVLANVEYGLEIKGVAPTERRERAREIIRTVGLADFERHYPSEISGGMRQRVGIARALLVRPKVLLMDEPFGALDAMTRELMQDELLGLVRSERLTVLFVTHSVDEAVYLSDRIFTMSPRPGRVTRVFDVNLRSTAEVGASIRSLPTYGTIRDEVWSMFRGAVKVA